MRRRACVAILAVLIIGSFGAVKQTWAFFKDGNELVTLYDAVEKDNATKEFLFYGYVQGVHDSAETQFCAPKDYQAKAIYAIVGNYLKAHPEEWNQPGNILVTKALKNAFPCPKK